MPASQSSALKSQAQRHFHFAGQTCPYCDQPIPEDKLEEISGRIEAKARERLAEETGRLRDEYARERQQADANARAELDRVTRDAAALLEKEKAESAARETAARDQVRAEATEEARSQIEAAEAEKQGVLRQYEALKADHEGELARRLQEVRDALQKDNADARNADKAAHSAEIQKLTGKLEDLTRQLEKKTNEELGEGAEVKLFDALRAEFDGDRIERVGRGNSGADILHTVIHNGRECGSIIYDSKNTTAWRTDYVSKLVQDQTAAKADHAVLSVLKFPADAKQLEVREGVIIVNPARAIAMVQILRRHMIQVHSLRLSKNERAKKMAALYDMITSERFGHLLSRIDSHTESLLELQAKEIKAHEDQWKKEGTHLRSIQKVKAELETEVDRIIGADDVVALGS